VHQLQNVYDASSSVFPVAGQSNPTLTRLTSHIAERPDI
jgi:hypothetical protein